MDLSPPLTRPRIVCIFNDHVVTVGEDTWRSYTETSLGLRQQPCEVLVLTASSAETFFFTSPEKAQDPVACVCWYYEVSEFNGQLQWSDGVEG